jgi:8-amino-7-oxononanoate synthase
MRRDARTLAAALAQLDRDDLRRAPRVVDARTREPAGEGDPPGAAIHSQGRRLVDFCSNDYLGLARHPEVITALQRAAGEWGVGSGAAHLVTGHTRAHAALEAALAAHTGRERALLFSTGYMANLGVLTALAARHDRVLGDRLNHASLIDAAKLSGARVERYAHADASSARALLERTGEGEGDAERAAVIATDGVFSMDGDLAPLRELAALAREHAAWLVVDDAHGLGVLGANGAGSLEHFSLTVRDVPVLVGTLGKAFGTFGAFVAGENDVIELILNQARTYIYTTAMPPALAAATGAALEVAQRESWRRARVLALAQRFRERAAREDLTLAASSTPIQPVRLGTTRRALAVSEALRERGFWVAAIRPPTVPVGAARLRVTLSAEHTEAQVDALVEALAESCAMVAADDPALPADAAGT